jgi:hypothetical protein
MNDQLSHRWFSELVAVVAAASELTQRADFTVSFVVDGEPFGLDLARRIATDGARASCEVCGAREVFERLVSGHTTLQKAYRSGELHLAGDPHDLLKLAFIFEKSSMSCRS